MIMLYDFHVGLVGWLAVCLSVFESRRIELNVMIVSVYVVQRCIRETRSMHSCKTRACVQLDESKVYSIDEGQWSGQVLLRRR